MVILFVLGFNSAFAMPLESVSVNVIENDGNKAKMELSWNHNGASYYEAGCVSCIPNFSDDTEQNTMILENVTPFADGDICLMKSTQLLSLVFSLIMFIGVSAGSVAFAEDVDSEMREKLERYCEMSDEDKRNYLAENDKTEEHAKKMDRYCTLSESDRADFIAEHSLFPASWMIEFLR